MPLDSATSAARGLHPQQVRLLALNAIGGAAVLASYVFGLGALSTAEPGLWGGVPESWRPAYTVNMLLAALGYFPFTGYWLLRADPARTRFAGGRGFGTVHALYAAILLPSALWLPLTAAYLAVPGTALWALIRLDLALVGLGAVGVLVALLTLSDPPSRGWRALAVAGCLPFVLQTAVLDAIVWPWLFPR